MRAKKKIVFRNNDYIIVSFCRYNNIMLVLKKNNADINESCVKNFISETVYSEKEKKDFTKRGVGYFVDRLNLVDIS